MSKEYSFGAADEKLVTDFPHVRTVVSMPSSLTIYQSTLLSSRIEDESARFFHSKGIKVRRYKPSMKGGGGGIDWLSALINFYHAHQNIFIFIKLLPKLVALIKKVVTSFEVWHTSRIYDFDNEKTSVSMYFTFYISEAAYTPNMYLSKLKQGTREYLGILPELKEYFQRKHPELRFVFNVTTRWHGSNHAVVVWNYQDQDKVLLKICRDLLDKNDDGKETLIYAIVKRAFLGTWKYKKSVNEAVI